MDSERDRRRNVHAASELAVRASLARAYTFSFAVRGRFGEPVITINDHMPGGSVGECSREFCNYAFEGERRAGSWSRMRIRRILMSRSQVYRDTV